MTTSFEAFAAEHVTPLLRYATALTGDPHLAQDVVQESLLRAQQRWDRIGGLTAPGAYLKRMVTNEFLSWRRRLRRFAPLADDITTPDPTTAYDNRDAVLRAVAVLPRKQRAALVLRYLEGLDDPAIADVLGCSPGTVRTHVSRALATLRVDARVKGAL
ncbi:MULTISPECIES: SigE family RNA polymerase sigma factor [Actinosynnema]|uniref:SigE family RNA polymerase sigma factor n=1 Tax=Actinosynnema TaxID=40566 RepID=UPI0020A53E79|nr:SigE family RNA polymerase sigma factor [Actinosynnema pretiosum]MCP2097935.1 RNA polymerase sigma-70 factor, sigma-E family [Actinosynnema pretiosum]